MKQSWSLAYPLMSVFTMVRTNPACAKWIGPMGIILELAYTQGRQAIISRVFIAMGQIVRAEFRTQAFIPQYKVVVEAFSIRRLLGSQSTCVVDSDHNFFLYIYMYTTTLRCMFWGLPSPSVQASTSHTHTQVINIYKVLF